MGLIEKEIFVCVDLEFTGLDLEKDRIIEVAAVQFNMNEILGEFQTLIDPECPISEVSIEIHRITEDMVKGKPKIGTIIPELLKFIGNRILVGHGIDFDMKWIDLAAKRNNIPCNITNLRFMDTLRLARLYGESPVNSLEFLREHFHLDFDTAHRAMSDVMVNIEVFKKLIYGYKKTEELFEALSNPISLKIMPLGKHKGRSFKEVPIEYLMWAAKKEFDQDLLFSIRSEIKRRRKGNLFSQSSNPFSNL